MKQKGKPKSVAISGDQSIELYKYVVNEKIYFSNGAVIVNELDDFPSNYKQYLEDEVYSVYTIRPISSATVKYNCHSYAWYNRSASNKDWLNDPSPYFRSGLYSTVSKTQAAVGDIIVYYESSDGVTYSDKEISHSAVIKTVRVYPRSSRSFTVVSKWGAWGLYEHSWAVCPYYIVNQHACNLKYYHKR
ncbi:MAG: hypothetical protein IKZ82_04405 [Clostridia bacterium]|nr:hypothetical protein [Clostridia bacterium]